ncbi:DUF3515 domain-containing protein [Streptomyces sp. NPDC014894]|uniref:DUF3515 domain-containing protein n=1 Tax=unclassified Streptomyces TaxID=2593676 RepID=UPI0036FAA013
MNPRRLAVFGVPVVVLLLIAAVYVFSGDPVKAAPPAVDKDAERMCEALHDELPDSVAGLERRDTEPSSRLTAAWGDPAVVLRCGVPRPAEMNNPKAPGAKVSDVDWMLEGPEDGAYRSTTVYREVYVELTLPTKYGDVSALMDLAAAIKKTIPSTFEDSDEHAHHE